MIDLVIVGGGPAGRAAAYSAWQHGLRDILILERDNELGGILNQCIHNGFGLHRFGEQLTCPEYAVRYIEMLRSTGVRVELGTIVLEVTPDKKIHCVSKEKGYQILEAKSGILCMGCRERTRGAIGIPLCLGFYELLPFWWAFWTKLGFAVHTSPVSSRGLYLAGQATIPSDTACFPAKLSHGHIKALSQMHLDAIFYPCLTYNFDEGLGDNHYNCPVVAYYSDVLAGNCPELEGKKFIYDYVGIHRPKDFVHKMAKNVLPKYFGGISEKEVQEAADAAYAEYEAHMAKIRVKGSEIIDEARRQGKRIIVLAGRPYHVDPEVNHGIDHLITRHGAAVVTEDSISNRVQKFPTSVLNQWTYHSRLYAAAKYCTTQKDMDLVQLVSFGCGVDAITTDETREILQRGNKLYTQLKIDEITNLGAVNIRLRSLFAALDERDEAAAEKSV